MALVNQDLKPVVACMFVSRTAVEVQGNLGRGEVVGRVRGDDHIDLCGARAGHCCGLVGGWMGDVVLLLVLRLELGV